MLKQYPKEQRDRAVRMVLDWLGEYRSLYAACNASCADLDAKILIHHRASKAAGLCSGRGHRVCHRAETVDGRIIACFTWGVNPVSHLSLIEQRPSWG
jgi:hypothetical protein